MCKLFNWTRSTMSGNGQNIFLNFLGRKKDACLPKCVFFFFFSKCTYGHNVMKTSTVSLAVRFFPVPLEVCLSSHIGWHCKTSPNKRTTDVSTCRALMDQLPNSNHFKTQVSLKQTRHRPLTQLLIDQDTEQACPSSAASPRPAFNQQAQNTSSSFSEINTF